MKIKNFRHFHIFDKYDKYIQNIAYQVVGNSWRAADLIFGNVSLVAMLVCNYIVIQRNSKLRKNVFVSTSSTYFVSGNFTKSERSWVQQGKYCWKAAVS